jgi:hypothetical protein
MLIWLILFILVVIMYSLQTPDTIETDGIEQVGGEPSSPLNPFSAKLFSKEQVGGLVRRGHYPLRRGYGWGWPWSYSFGWPWGWRWKYRRYHPHRRMVFV